MWLVWPVVVLWFSCWFCGCCGLWWCCVLSCILEEGSLFSQPGEDYPSHDEGSVSLSFLSAILNFIPLACLGFDFPHVCLPVCGFAFLSISVTASFLAFCSFRDSFFGSPAFSSSQNISCFARLIARCLKKRKNAHVRHIQLPVWT